MNIRHILFLCFTLLFSFNSNAQSEYTKDNWEEDKKDLIYVNSESNSTKKAPLKQGNSDGNSGGAHIESSFPNIHFPDIGVFILYAFVIVAVGLIIYFIVINFTLPRSAPKPKSEINTAEDLQIEEKLMETDLERLLRLALENENYQLAIRYTFLMTLQLFVKKNKLKWKKQATNKDYLRQLHQTPYYEHFRELVLTYERKWYRNDMSNRGEYENYNLACLDLHKKI